MVTETIEYYWRPGCPFCAMLSGPLRASGLPITEINIWEDSEAAARVRAVANGNEVVPTVIIGDQALVNPSIDEILKTVEEHAPHLLNS
ncbi:NrdH-redoxin [Pseudonocardiaceae bacterium YIM PH 21723]|nr:NrdH-redoxin [Pseudonocardiaceae bacterium YIM PH 21723]